MTLASKIKCCVLFVVLVAIVSLLVSNTIISYRMNEFRKEMAVTRKYGKFMSLVTEKFYLTDDKGNSIMYFGYEDNEEYPAPTIFKIYEPGTNFERVIGFLSKEDSKIYVKQIITDNCVILTPDVEASFNGKNCYTVERRKSQLCCMKSVLIK